MGRPRKPYLRKSDNSWVSRFGGRYVKLAKGRENKAEAFRKFHELELAERIAPNPDAVNLTVAGVIESYLEYARTRCAPATFSQRRQYLQLFAEAHGWRRVNDSDCKPLHLSSWLDTHPEWKSAWSRATITTIVQRPFNWAVQQRLVTANPFRGVASSTGMPRRPMTDDEFEKLLAAIEGKKFKNGPSPADRFREMLTFLRHTGARPGEASALKWDQVDLAAGCALLREHKTAKTQRVPKPRVIVFDEAVKALLASIRDRGDPGENVFLTYRLYGEELRVRIQSEFSDTSVYGDELSRTLALLDHGGLSPAAKLYHAMKGWGTDEATIKAVLANKTPGEIQAIRDEFNSLYAAQYGETLDEAITSELSGRDEFEVLQLLQRRPTDVLGRLQRLEAKQQYERTGIWNGFSSTMIDWFSSDGTRLDAQVVAARQAYDAAMSDGVLTPQETAEIERLLGYAEEGVVTYQDVKDSAADTFGTVLSTAAGIAVVWATGGAATPLVLAVLRAGGTAAIGQVIGQVTISGQSYDVEALPGNLLEGFVNGGTIPITFGGLPNASTAFGRLLQGGRSGALEG